MISELKSNGFESIDQNEMYNIDGGLIVPTNYEGSKGTAAWVAAGAIGGAVGGLLNVAAGAAGGFVGSLINGDTKIKKKSSSGGYPFIPVL